MRFMSLLPTLALFACASPTVQTAATYPGTADIDAALAEMDQGIPQVCIPDRADNMVRSYGHNLLFKVGEDYYVNRVEGACDNPGTTGQIYLIDRRSKDPMLCRHTNIRMVSKSAGMFGGNCNLGDFVPYRVRT